MRLYQSLIILMCALLFSKCGSDKALTTVSSVDLKRYQGTWYEIARFPNSFEKGLDCTTANYTLREDGKVTVINKGRKTKTNTWKESKGKAWVPDSTVPGQLKVSFFWPFAGDYFVMALDDEYQHVLVGSPSREYLWILARNKSLPEAIYKELTDIAQKEGFPVEQLERINQTCN